MTIQSQPTMTNPPTGQPLVFDLEADGLLQSVQKVWCIATLPLTSASAQSESAETSSALYGPQSVWKGIESLMSCSQLIGHNIVSYDIRVLFKLYGDHLKFPPVLDTLILSRFLRPERLGGHSLAAWGERLGGEKKLEYNDWSKYTPEMGVYCQRDVELNLRVYHALLEEWNETSLPSIETY